MTSTHVGRGRATTSSAGRLRRLTLVMLLLLLIQFGLGIATNLYVKIPLRHPGARAADYLNGLASGIGWVIPNGAIALAAHVALGLALVVVGIDLMVRSIRTAYLPQRAGLIWASAIGLAAIIGAAFNGVSFLNYSHNVSSLSMGLLFALAVGAYVVELYLIPHPRPDTR